MSKVNNTYWHIRHACNRHTEATLYCCSMILRMRGCATKHIIFSEWFKLALSNRPSVKWAVLCTATKFYQMLSTTMNKRFSWALISKLVSDLDIIFYLRKPIVTCKSITTNKMLSFHNPKDGSFPRYTSIQYQWYWLVCGNGVYVCEH